MEINVEVLISAVKRAREIRNKSTFLRKQIESRNERIHELEGLIKNETDYDKLNGMFAEMVEIVEKNNADLAESQKCFNDITNLRKLASFITKLGGGENNGTV